MPDGSRTPESPSGSDGSKSSDGASATDGSSTGNDGSSTGSGDSSTGTDGSTETTTTPPTAKEFTFQPAFLMHVGGSHYDGVRDVAFTADGGMVFVGGAFINADTGKHDMWPTGVTPKLFKNTTCGIFSSGQDMDAFVVRIDPQGTIQWMTFLGGPNYERAYAVEVASDGDIVIAGRSGPCLPTTPGAMQQTFGGGETSRAYGLQDGYVARLKPDGDLRWATYVGGSDDAFIRDMALDSKGNPVVGTFATEGASFPQWPGGSAGNPWQADVFKAGAFQTSETGDEDSIVLKLSSDGSRALWAARLGGSDADGSQPSIRVAPDDSVVFLTHGMSSDFNANASPIYSEYSVGMFESRVNHGNLVKLTSNGKHVFTRYLGGHGSINGDTHNLWVDKNGLIYTGDCLCAAGDECFNPIAPDNDPPQKLTDLDPAPTGVQTTYAGGGFIDGNWITGNYPGDGQIIKLSADGSKVLASTLLGGRYGEGIEGITVTDEGTVVVSGGTMSQTMTSPKGGAVGSFQGGLDGFVAVLSPDLKEVLYLRYLGGPGDSAGLSVATAGERIIMSGSVGSSSTLHLSPDGRFTAPVQRLANTGSTKVLPDLGVLGAADAFIYVFDQKATPAAP